MLQIHKDKFPMFDGWGAEYFACTLSESLKETVRQYIMNQKEHHKQINTRDEIIKLCNEFGITYNEKYI